MERSPTDRTDLSALRIHDDQRRRRPLGRWIAAAGGLVVLGLLVVGGLTRGGNGRVEVVVAAAQPPDRGPGAQSTLLNASGYVTPRRRATVSAKITGKVTRVAIDEGMRVERGQILAQLDDSDYQATLAAAKADRDATAAGLEELRVTLANARRELARVQGLAREGIQTPEALDAAQTAVDSLRARIDAAETQVRAGDARIRVAEQNVENCRIRAPFSGLIVSKDAQPGEMVSPNSAGGGFTRTGIATIVDMTSLEIEVDVNENYIARVTPSQPVVATLDAYPDWHIPGRVRTVIPTADREKGTVKVRATFDHLDPRILPDMGVKLAFLADDQAAHASADEGTKAVAVIPASAVRSMDGRTVVFLLRDGVLERRAVRTQPAHDELVTVLAGIAPGDLVVTGGPGTLRDGQPAVARP